MAGLKDKNTGIIRQVDLKHTKVRIFYWTCFTGLLITALICLLPPLWVMSSSLKDIEEFFAVPATIIPRSFHPEKLLETWNKLNFGLYYLNTAKVVAGAAFFSVFFNGLAGYVLSRLKPRGSSFIMALMLWTMMIPSSISIVPLFKNIVKVPLLNSNLTNTFLPLWFMAGASAFFVIIFKSFFDTIPGSLIESARIDGSNELNTFVKIVLPMSKPVIMVILILTVNAVWADFLWPYLILRDNDLYTVMVKIFQMKKTIGYSTDLQVISLTFAIVPPAILFMIFQKNIVEGFTMSGIKG